MRELGRRGPFSGWPAAAVALVDRAAERHGGWTRWATLSSVTLQFETLGGPLPWMKGLGRTFVMPPRVTVWPHQCRVRFFDWYGGEGQFERGDVRRERDGAVVEASADHRRTFSGAQRRRRWQPLDGLYFFGYALSNYLAQPFLLSHAQFVDADARRVRVAFPDDWPAHCRVQRFWFADDGLLRRHDYVADIVGRWASGAHFVDDFIDVDGFWVARRRRVTGRIGSWATPLPVLHARFGAVAIS